MDTLTHALSGALLARATAGNAGNAEVLPLSRRIALGAVAAAFPDADIVMSLGSPIAFMLNHRGLTHSLVVLPIWAWLLAWLASRLWRDPRGWRPYFAVTAMGIGIHIAGDLITSYGTMIFAPLSDARFALGTTFIIDLYFSGIILAGLAASRLWRASRTPAALAAVPAHRRQQAQEIGVRVTFPGRNARRLIATRKVTLTPISPCQFLEP